MLISEVAHQTGFSKDTIRWYEKIGLIKLDKTARTENNYRNYNTEIVTRLHLIKQMKSFGFSLDEVKDLLVLIGLDDLICDNVSKIVDPKILAIERKITELQQLKSKLILAKEKCSGNCIELFEDR